jgi:hypothetical protein
MRLGIIRLVLRPLVQHADGLLEFALPVVEAASVV